MYSIEIEVADGSFVAIGGSLDVNEMLMDAQGIHARGYCLRVMNPDGTLHTAFLSDEHESDES